MTESHDGRPEPSPEADLFIDFANTLHVHDGEPEDRVSDADTLRAWLAERTLVGAETPLARVDRAIPEFRELRSLIHDITERLVDDGTPSAQQVRRLNRVLRDGLHYHRLEPADDGSRFTIGQVGDELAQARSAIAGSLAHYVADHDVERLRICANDGCRWRFLDRSPAGRRRWCDMRTCGNRAKVARHRARARSSTTSTANPPARPAVSSPQ
jgi:predicted RNA-binding Zn ribbon-like protein